MYSILKYRVYPKYTLRPRLCAHPHTHVEMKDRTGLPQGSFRVSRQIVDQYKGQTATHRGGTSRCLRTAPEMCVRMRAEPGTEFGGLKSHDFSYGASIVRQA